MTTVDGELVSTLTNTTNISPARQRCLGTSGRTAGRRATSGSRSSFTPPPYGDACTSTFSGSTLSPPPPLPPPLAHYHRHCPNSTLSPARNLPTLNPSLPKRYLYLQANSIPLFRFELHAHAVLFKYLFTSMTTGVEIGAVIMGPLACVATLAFFTTAGYSVVKFVGHVPDWFSKFVAAWCAGCILDPLLVLAVDLVAGNFGCSRLASCWDDYTAAACQCVEGDAFKLWSRLESEDASGVMGLVYTAIIYCATIIVSLAGSYVYFLHVHMNGRMLDVRNFNHTSCTTPPQSRNSTPHPTPHHAMPHHNRYTDEFTALPTGSSCHTTLKYQRQSLRRSSPLPRHGMGPLVRRW